MARALMIARAKAEAGITAGIYSVSRGQIIVPESMVEYWVLAHEMAHAFAAPG